MLVVSRLCQPPENITCFEPLGWRGEVHTQAWLPLIGCCFGWVTQFDAPPLRSGEPEGVGKEIRLPRIEPGLGRIDPGLGPLAPLVSAGHRSRFSQFARIIGTCHVVVEMSSTGGDSMNTAHHFPTRIFFSEIPVSKIGSHRTFAVALYATNPVACVEAQCGGRRFARKFSGGGSGC